MSRWFSGSGYEIDYEDLLETINQHTTEGGAIYIGTDSFLTKNHCIFATAICLHGAKTSHSGKYYIHRNKASSKKFKSLLGRIMTEVEKTIFIAMELDKTCPDLIIELHLDISATNKPGETSKFSDMLTGYAKSTGFSCKIKPDSWASSAVADRHSKK